MRIRDLLEMVGDEWGKELQVDVNPSNVRCVRDILGQAQLLRNELVDLSRNDPRYAQTPIKEGPYFAMEERTCQIERLCQSLIRGKFITAEDAPF